MKISIRRVKRKVKIGDLFNEMDIKEEELYTYLPNYKIQVKTPYGYKKILSLFRTEKQKPVTTYFSNGVSLETSSNHKIKSNGEWKYIKDLIKGDAVEIENGCYTRVIKKSIDKKKKILYDISVEDVQCYYSNGILSHNSWFLASIGAAALKAGKKVIHYTLELSPEYTGLRYDSILTGIPFQNLKFHKKEVKETIEEYKNLLIIKQYPATLATVNTLRAHIKRAEVLAFKPDVIILDYADLLSAETMKASDNSYSVGGKLYEKLRGLAVEAEVPIWTASQTHRCIFLDTNVEIKNKGVIKIKDVKVGDKIKTHKGFKTITTVFPITKQPAYKIKLKSGKEIIVSSKHKFPVMYGYLKSIESGLKVGDRLFIEKSNNNNIKNNSNNTTVKLADLPMDEIILIEFIGENKTIDIEVEDTHMFFANGIYTHNSAAEEDIIEGHNIAESFKKVMTADFIFSVSRKVEDKVAGTGRIHIVKNRFGADGLTFNAKINASNGNIVIYDNGTIGSATEAKKQANGGEYRRKILANRYKELKEFKDETDRI